MIHSSEQLTQGLNIHELYHVPDKIPDRTLEVDADFLAYQVASKDDCSFTEMQTNTRIILDKLMSKAGASSYTLHLTPKESTKGNRKQIALLAEYQGNRAGKVKPALLHAIRSWMHSSLGAVLHLDREADDGIAEAVYRDPKNCIICSKDKDLRMIPGTWLDWESGELDTTDDPFGYLELWNNKLSGRGWKFFFAQLLMGDPVDNIKGLPKYVNDKRQLKNIGPKTTYSILDSISTVEEAYSCIIHMYSNAWDEDKSLFLNYRDQSEIHYTAALISNMKLLWMRRNSNENDVLFWLQENLHAIH